MGLIGASVAASLRRCGGEYQLFGYDKNPASVDYCLSTALIDRAVGFENIVNESDVVIVCTPCDSIPIIVKSLLDSEDSDGLTIIEMGSIKRDVCSMVRGHKRRGLFVASHPMAGTENSGAASAQETLFDGKSMIICERELSSQYSLDIAMSIFKDMRMMVSFSNPDDHDRAVADVSHICHLISFALSTCVLEESDETILRLASGGFATTVRLAASSATTWVPIFSSNSDNILEVLDRYIKKLDEFKRALQTDDKMAMSAFICRANDVQRVLKK